MLTKPSRIPPKPDEIAHRLGDFCRKSHISRLDVFGSVARGTTRCGSDVDLVVTFSKTPGLSFFGMADEMENILGVPVDLLTHEDVDTMSNPYRKQAILSDIRKIYPCHENASIR